MAFIIEKIKNRERQKIIYDNDKKIKKERKKTFFYRRKNKEKQRT